MVCENCKANKNQKCVINKLAYKFKTGKYGCKTLRTTINKELQKGEQHGA